MSTRCVVNFMDGESDETAKVYLHSDGYPEGVGTSLSGFFKKASELDKVSIGKTVGGSRFSDASYLAAKFVVFMAEEYRSDFREYVREGNSLDFLSVGILHRNPMDVEFIYEVRCDKMDANGYPKVLGWTVKANRRDKLVTVPLTL